MAVTFRGGTRVEPAQPAPAPPAPPGKGPGTELMALLRQLGFEDAVGCRCHEKAELMDRWGVEGCRRERATILAWMRHAQAGLTDWARARAAVNAVAGGLAGVINPLSPTESLLDEAIRRAEAKEKA